MSVAEPGSLRIGVLVPCRNEAAVIGRKLGNLALARWPAPGRPHRIVLVDDGSEDGTADRARAFDVARLPAGVRFSVRPNTTRPGKPGAIATGLDELAGTVDLVVLTDADVLIDPDALVALERAFATDARLALACGAQRFVRDLADDGSCRSKAGGQPVDAATAFDRWTARVRRCESRFGRLFSVHGQLLAWRAELRLRPRPGIAADDLDLMLQARARASEPRRVALVREAVFLEAKTPPGRDALEQALRRARAFVQVVRSRPPLARDPVSLAQWGFYRYATLAAPELGTVASLLAIGGAYAAGGTGLGVFALLLVVVVSLSGPGRRWSRLARIIRAARHLEELGALPERWEMARR